MAFRLKLSLLLTALLLTTSFAFGAQLKDNLSVRKLSNSIELVMRPDTSHPVASIIVIVKNTGSICEEEFLGCGISHLVEHMVFKGAENGTDSQISQKFHALGADIGAFVDKHRTVFTVNMDSRALEEAVALLPSIIFENEFEQTSFDNEKDVIRRELAMNNDDPERTLIDSVFSHVYRKHPYRYPVGGYKPLFDTVTMEQAFDYYKSHYVPGNIVICVAGDFDPEKIEAAVRKNFEHYPWKPFRAPEIKDEPEQYAPITETITNKNIKTAYAALAFRTCDSLSPDMPPLDMLASALGQGNDSVLVRKLKHEEKLVYSISALSYTPDYPGLFLVRINCETSNLEKAKTRTLEIINEYTKTKLDPTRVEELKKETVNSKYFALQNAQTVAMELGIGQAISRNPAYIDEYLDSVSEVTPESIADAAAKYLVPERACFVSLVPENDTQTQAVETKEIKTARPEMKRLENGLKVAVNTNSRLPIVSVALAMHGGVSREKEELSGISALTATMLLRGTKNYDMYEQERRVRAQAGSLSQFSGYHSLGLRLSIPSAELETGLRIMSDALKNPLLDPSILEHEKTLQIKSIELIDEDIYQSALLAFRRTHFEGTPYSRLTQGTKETVTRITAGDISGFLDDSLDPESMVISFSGDISMDKALELAGKHFGWIKSKSDKNNVPEQNDPADRTKGRTITEQCTFNQSAVIIGFDAPGSLSEDSWTVTLLDAYLSGPSTPLFRKVRDEAGAAYMVGSIYLPAIDTGAFIVYAGTTADKAGLSSEKMLSVIDLLHREEIAPDELETAKRKIIGQNKISLQDNAAIAFSMALDELNGKGYDSFTLFEQKIGNLNPADLKAAVEKYLSPKRATQICLLGRSSIKS